jgi:Na+-driven multidrug efflux pump
MSAQNIGAGEFDRARKTLSTGCFLPLYNPSCIFYCSTFPAAVTSLFTSETEVITYSIGYIRAVSLDFVLLPFMFCMNGFQRRRAHPVFSCQQLHFGNTAQIPLAYIFMKAFGLGLLGVGFAAPLATVDLLF